MHIFISSYVRLESFLSTGRNVCSGKTVNIWIFLDPTEMGPTLGVVVMAVNGDDEIRLFLSLKFSVDLLWFNLPT